MSGARTEVRPTRAILGTAAEDRLGGMGSRSSFAPAPGQRLALKATEYCSVAAVAAVSDLKSLGAGLVGVVEERLATMPSRSCSRMI